MQENARLLGSARSLDVVVRCGGQGRIRAVSVSGERVLVGLEDMVFKSMMPLKRKDIVCPAGTVYKYNERLGAYHVLPEGMYRAKTALMHTMYDVRDDARDVREQSRVLSEIVNLLSIGKLTDEASKDAIDEKLREIAKRFDAPKYNEHKLAASEKLARAVELRAQAKKRRVPMPTAHVIHAAVVLLDRRGDIADEMLHRLDPEYGRVYALVEGVHARLDAAWKVFGPEAFRWPGHLIIVANADHRESDVKKMRDVLISISRGLREIRVRPLNGLARASADGIDTLVKKIIAGRGTADIADDLAAIRESLATMKTVRRLETEILSLISVFLGEWMRLGPAHQESARESVSRACDATSVWCDNVSSDAGMTMKLRDKVTEVLATATRILGDDHYGDSRKRLNRVKRSLKALSVSLTS